MAHEPKQLTKDTKAVGAAILEEIPGAGAVLAAVDAASRRRRRKKFEWYTGELVKVMALADHDALAALIEQHGEEDWCAEGFEEGFRTVMSAVDETAKKCALLMTADYLGRHDAPDRVYRQLANLLAEVDASVLQALFGMAEAIRALENDWVVFSAMHELDHSAEFFQARNRADVVIRLPQLPDSGIMYTSVDLLRRHQFLATPSFMERSLPHTRTIEHDAYLGTMLPHQLPLWKRLSQYLKAFRHG